MLSRWPPQCRFSPKDTSEVSILEYELNAGCRARLNHSHSLSACFGGWSQHQPGELRENVHSKLHSKQLMVYYYRPRHCIMGNVPKKSQVRFAPLDLLEAWVSLCKSIPLFCLSLLSSDEAFLSWWGWALPGCLVSAPFAFTEHDGSLNGFMRMEIMWNICRGVQSPDHNPAVRFWSDSLDRTL